MINRVSGGTPIRAAGTRSAKSSGTFGAALAQELAKTDKKRSGVEFSKHAMARAEERGIEVTPALMDRLTDSVDRAQDKGARNILVLDANRAFIINVPSSRVVTTMASDEMRENIFTNIDSAVLL